MGGRVVPVSGISEKPESSSVRMADNEQLEQQKERLKQLRHMVAIFTYLAIHEKAGSCFGKLAFIWATVVILGGFAKDIKNVEFNIVAVLLVIEGARVICRSSEFTVPRRSFIYVLLVGLEMSAALATFLLGYYRYFGSLDDYNTLKCQSDPISPSCPISPSDPISTEIYAALHDYNSLKNQSLFDPISTQYAALGYFYGFCIADGCFIFLGKGYMLLTFIIDIIVEHIYGCSSDKSKADKSKAHKLSRVFSYALYVRYIKGSIFEGREIRILSLGVELLQSTDDYEQLAGAQFLLDCVRQSIDNEEPVQFCKCGIYRRFSKWMSISDPIPKKTLWAILTGRDVVERLIIMLKWKNEREQKRDQEIRKAAEDIVSIMVEKIPNLIVLPPELRSALPFNLREKLERSINVV